MISKIWYYGSSGPRRGDSAAQTLYRGGYRRGVAGRAGI